MKVVLVSRFPSNIDQPRGGVETATVALAKALFSLGITDLHIVTIEKHLPEICIENHEGLTVHRLRRSRWRFGESRPCASLNWDRGSEAFYKEEC